MPASPHISIVIPTHRGQFLAATVASVRAQTLPDWELVIVDDGSTDGTAALAAALAASDPRIRVVTLARNQGIALARNAGLAAITAGSHLVAFLDHDDMWTPDALESLAGALAARPEASAAHGIATCVDPDGTPVAVPGVTDRLPFNRRGVVHGRVTTWPVDQPTEFINLAYEDCIASVGSILIRRAALEQVGGFDARAEPADDYDMWIRLSRVGSIAFLPKPVLLYRLHPLQSGGRPPPGRGRGTPYVRYKLITSPDNSPEQHRLARTSFRARQYDLAAADLSAATAALRRRDYRAAGRGLSVAVSRLATCVRGRPWSWHR
jgi:glycosyltransferase involved in cell wall biosynthesis